MTAILQRCDTICESETNRVAAPRFRGTVRFRDEHWRNFGSQVSTHKEDIPQEVEDIQRMIASLETLAQVALIVVTKHIRSGRRTLVTLPLNTDNTPTEGEGNKICSGRTPDALYSTVSWVMLTAEGRSIGASPTRWTEYLGRPDKRK